MRIRANDAARGIPAGRLSRSIGAILIGAALVVQAAIGTADASTPTPSAPVETIPCKGIQPPIIGPVVLSNYNSFLPITIAGVPAFGGWVTKPLKLVSTPFCVCPSKFFGVPLPGVMVSWFTPRYVAEVMEVPGCISTIGKNLLPSYTDLKQSASTDAGGGGDSVKQRRRQVHLLDNAMGVTLRQMQSAMCMANSSGLQTTYITEPDPLWQHDQWSAIFAPESILFANPVAALACGADFIAANAGQPIDELFWCNGGKSLYPLASSDQLSDDLYKTNELELHRFAFRQARLGILWRTIGVSAKCSPHVSPILSKQQFRIDPVWPIPPGFGRPAFFGMHKFMARTLGTYPTQESAVYNLWEATQCCVGL